MSMGREYRNLQRHRSRAVKRKVIAQFLALQDCLIEDRNNQCALETAAELRIADGGNRMRISGKKHHTFEAPVFPLAEQPDLVRDIEEPFE